MNAADIIATITGRRPVRLEPLSGGCVGDVRRVRFADGPDLVAKFGRPGSGLALEGWMLDYLRAHAPGFPVPAVVHADDTLLLMEFVPTGGGLTAEAEAHAADLVAGLHAVGAPRFGLERDTLIGGLRQPNAEAESWRDFFRDRRLLFMAEEAHRAGRLPSSLRSRIDTLAARLDQWIEEPDRPSLIHGDLWGGNVLCRDGRIAAFIDPAIYYADPEIELAFGTLFGTFGPAFFRRYAEHRPLRPGFFEMRRDLYNLYPLLVHVRLFGGSYVGDVERIVRVLI